ncbi:DUF3043 domain-containing protein [Corynebacterium liangguodongii]|uniref:DUF3043 domain-containing protein n=1 Tax=Corynebacterium liangguodongii TaxID=2079535 RepID=A0A2S0WF49_9CORY|nr:DUF3043 domain-containing protein [Corynebacterium liangguodongii]AWB84380.1 DUF3043 domain-containing protein [Corynebacterium liangguodongii]PWB99870.1 DUF3043 domain-containing protein [Corynebacterium liangguodongii]
MRIPWQKSDSEGGSTAIELPKEPAGPKGSAKKNAGASRESAGPRAQGDAPLPKGYTPPKGRPTPKRHEQEIKRGVVRDPNALTPAQQAQRNKELKKSMSPQEWKDYKKRQREQRREATREAQARMDAGDERYMLDRDKGEVRAFVRDWVDSRRFINNWVMPAALVILVLTFAVSYATPQVANAISLISLAFMITIIAEALIIGRGANRAVTQKFPGSGETGFALGMYAFSRATQPRRWRTPKPRVAAGKKVN